MSKPVNVVNFVIISVVGIIGISLLGVITFKCIENIKDKKVEVYEPRLPSEVKFREIKDPSTDRWMYRISKVEFEGHTYIVLEDTGSCLLHDPDCKCQNPK